MKCLIGSVPISNKLQMLVWRQFLREIERRHEFIQKENSCRIKIKVSEKKNNNHLPAALGGGGKYIWGASEVPAAGVAAALFGIVNGCGAEGPARSLSGRSVVPPS